jgi:hypothetical protein
METVKKEKPRYFLTTTEEMIMNREFDGFRGGRIEIYDEENKGGYALTEVRFFVPENMYNGFIEMFDFKSLTLREMKHLRLMFDGEEIIKL